MPAEVAIGLLALVLSLWNLALWYQWRQPCPTIEVKRGILSSCRDEQLLITIKNRRPHVTQVVAVWMDIPDPAVGEKLVFPRIAGEEHLPFTLQPFHCLRLWTPRQEAIDELKEHGVSVQGDVTFWVEVGSGHMFSGTTGVLADGPSSTQAPD